MKTTIYLIRHSVPFKEHLGIIKKQESILIENEKTPLSILGEEIASKYFTLEEFQNIDTVWSSNYVRAMSTAKYLAYYNQQKVNISEVFNERIHGINSWKELPYNFEEHQFKDANYKIGFGESQNEVQARMLEGMKLLLAEYSGKRIAVVSHATAMMYLLKKWCHVEYDGAEGGWHITFKGKSIFQGFGKYLETFKLTFDENGDLTNIENIYHNKDGYLK